MIYIKVDHMVDKHMHVIYMLFSKNKSIVIREKN